MPRFVLATIAVFLISSCAWAQDTTAKGQIFGGYSLFHVDTGGLTGAKLDSAFGTPSGTFRVTSNFNGWTAEAQYDLKRGLGIVADISGHDATPITAANGSGITGLPTATAYSFLFGPVFSFKARSKMTPFVHALFGLDRLSLASGSSIGRFANAAVTDNAIAMAFGGGVDYKLTRGFSVRLGQFDYIYTAHDLDSIYGDSFGAGTFQGLATHENNLRFSTGITMKF